MPLMLKAAGIGGSLLVLVALLITFLKSAIGFIGFLTFAIKIAVVLLFVLLIVGVGFMVVKGLGSGKKPPRD